MSIHNQAASAPVQDLYFGLPVQESVVGWIANIQPTENDENHPNLIEDTQHETQITSHLDNLGPAPRIQRLDGVLPIQETGQVINQRFTQSSEYDIGLEFPETPADLDEFDSQKPSPLAQGFDSGPIKQENVPRTAERQPTENSESRGSVNSSVAPFECWQIEPGQIQDRPSPQLSNIIVPATFIFDEYGYILDDQDETLFPEIPADLNNIEDQPANNQDHAGVGSDIVEPENGQIQQVDEDGYLGDNEEEEDEEFNVDENGYLGDNEEEEDEEFNFPGVPANLNNFANQQPNDDGYASVESNVAEPEDGQIEIDLDEDDWNHDDEEEEEDDDDEFMFTEAAAEL